MSNYELDVDSPFPKPSPDVAKPEFEKPSYNNKNKIQFRTYGVNMQHLVEKVAEYPENVRNAFAPMLANHLKMMYLTYNRDSVNDELIRHQIDELSSGKIILPEDFGFTTTKELLNTATANASFYVTPSTKKKKKKKKKKKPSAI